MKNLAALLCLLLLAGCAAFPGDELSSQPFRAPASEQQHRPNVLVEFNFYRGEAQDKDATSIAVAREGLKPTLRQVLERSGLFDRITLVPAIGQPDDALLRLKLYNSTSYAAAIASGLITGATFFLVPGTAKDDYVLTAEWLPPASQTPLRAKNAASVRTWMGIWFLPLAASHSAGTAIEETFRRQVNDVLKQLQADSAFADRSSAQGNGETPAQVTP
ncbi:hypothetical protein [Pseudomonas oryzihabitans]|uniref:Lipoprotein n=1 Tax=Pseudomonas oryzihabitans TaxID=47885 RepID=A0AAJ2BER9_9PSED|nr:hypothetical protein [Pseudomonas psychrotolerans]MDR6232729.1 hypothetical protein [Pseudomonas psychrotolerans]MDR6358337.1 hypothetical protein [Pseudomonas psychrotolerans]